MQPLPSIPRFEHTADGSVVVTRWGTAGSWLLKPGDRIRLSSAPPRGRLVVLVPRGYGHPVLGRSKGSRLRLEPSGLPAHPGRWSVAGTAAVLERRLERGMPRGSKWFVTVRAWRDGKEVAVPDWVDHGWMEAGALDALCVRLAAQSDTQFGVVAGASSSASGVDAVPDYVRFELPAAQQAALQSNIVPFPVPRHATHRPAAEHGLQMALFEDRPQHEAIPA